MALLNTFTDSRTLAAVGSAANVTYAHGITIGTPDIITVIANASVANTAAPFALSWAWDATNVTIWNGGNSASPVLKAVAQVIHSIQR